MIRPTIFYGFCSLISCCSVIGAFPQVDKKFEEHFILSPIFGLSNHRLSYSIAGNERGNSPNIFSELKWSGLRTLDYGLKVKGMAWSKIIYSLQYTRSRVLSGNVSDVDYAEDNRQGVFSEQYFSSHRGFLNSFSGQIGYYLIDRPRFSSALLFGIDYLHQRAYLLNDKDVDRSTSQYDYIEGLYSFYRAGWKSFGANLWLEYMVFSSLSAYGDFGLYLSSYNGYGSWNLRVDFEQPRSYTHDGNGTRTTGELGLSYQVFENVFVGFGWHYNTARLSNGKDKLSLIDGATLSTRLNEVHYKMNGIVINTFFAF